MKATSITIHQDGQVLVGRAWTLPRDYQAAEVAEGLLPSLKGATPSELPRLDDNQAGDQGTYFLRNDFPIF